MGSASAQHNTVAVLISFGLVCILLQGIAAENATNGRSESAADKQIFVVDDRMQCYVCRSDENDLCTNSVTSDLSFRQVCTPESYKRFYDALNRTGEGQLPSYDRSLARYGGNRLEWGCYSMFSSNNGFTFRSCIPNPSNREAKYRCNKCDTPGKNSVPAKCCTCTGFLCNEKNSWAVCLSPSFSLRMYISIGLLLLGVNKMIH